jgi:hypothetical protein
MDLRTDSWSTLPSLRCPRIHPRCTVHGDSLWVVGGSQIPGVEVRFTAPPKSVGRGGAEGGCTARTPRICSAHSPPSSALLGR